MTNRRLDNHESLKRRLIRSLIHHGHVKCAPADNPFVLKSGKTSDVYVDLRHLGATPELNVEVCKALLNIIPAMAELQLQHGYVAGLPLGGIPLATLVSAYGNLRLLLIRKESKDHGTGRIIEADIKRETLLLLVDDVISSGSTVRETIERIRKTGVPIKVIGVLCVVNRCPDAPPTVPGTEIPIYSLLTLEDILKVERKPSFGSRKSSNTITQELFELMERKKTNVCWSADVDDPKELIRIFELVGPHIALIKIHFDGIAGLKMKHVGLLFGMATRLDVMVMADRKFADIGSTVKKQLECNLGYNKVDSTMRFKCSTVHPIAGDAGIKVLQAKNICSILVAEMSNTGSLPDYAKEAVKMAESHANAVMGFICQSRRNCDAGDDFVYMTPGVHLEKQSDGGDQHYRDCDKAIRIQNNDVVIVGRGIHKSSDPLEAVKRYRNAAWYAYTTPKYK